MPADVKRVTLLNGARKDWVYSARIGEVIDGR